MVLCQAAFKEQKQASDTNHGVSDKNLKIISDFIKLYILRRWVPGCGLRLIVNAKPPKKPALLFPKEDVKSLPDYYAPCQSLSVNDYVKNIHVFTQFGSLTPMQILTIFDQFIQWPEYESSAFGELKEKHLEKIYANPDENSHEIESDDEDEPEVVNEENR